MSALIEVRFEVRDVPEAAGGRLDRFLAARIRGTTRAAAQRMLEEGRVRVEGRGGTPRPSTRVALEDTVVVLYPRRFDPPADVDRLGVLYEDDSLLIVDKPAGVLSHPTDKAAHNSVTEILKLQFPGAAFHLAHRLDRETSGVLVLAKDPAAARSLQEQFERRETAKEYLALVSGRPSWDETVVDLPLAGAGGEIRVRQAGSPDGYPALTEFRVEASGPDRALVRCRPRTGRLHQIRVHLAHLGHPILGDLLYRGGGELYLKAVARTLTSQDREASGAPRQMLHARSLTLNHPVTGAPLTVEAPVPEDFRAMTP